MAPCLEDCPPEITEGIITLLDLHDVCSLRQTCLLLAAKAAQNHFKSFFISKHIDLTEATLRAFVAVTQHGGLACLVQDLVLTSLAGDVDESDSSNQGHSLDILADFLGKAFDNISQHNKSGGLASISLRVEVMEGGQRVLPIDAPCDSWRVVWDSAAKNFHTAMHALSLSKMSCLSLNVFNDRGLQRCSLACDELGRLNYDDLGLMTSLSCLKVLSMSLSRRIVESDTVFDLSMPQEEKDPTEKDFRVVRSKASTPSNFIGLAKITKLARNLEDLEIHYYYLSMAPEILKGTLYGHHRLLLRQVALSDGLPTLSNCRLRGVHISEEDLLNFLKLTTPRCLSLENVKISSGSLSNLWKAFACENTRIETLHFNNIYEEGKCLHFPDGDIVYSCGGSGRTLLRRTAADARKPITTYTNLYRIRDTPRTRELRLQRYRKYGVR